MLDSEKIIKIITQVLLLGVIAIVPFIKLDALYFPFVSGKVYIFRALVILAFFFWVWLMLKGKEWRPDLKNILIVSIVIFFLGQVVTSFFGVDPIYSLFSSIERADGVLQYGFWVVYFLMLVSVFKSWLDWKIFIGLFTVVASVLSVYSWFNFETQGQLSGFFGNPAYFAAFLLFAIGFCLVAFERKIFKEPIANKGFLVFAGFFAVTLLLTQVRGVYVGLGGGVLLFCVLAILFLRKENKRLAFACGALLLVGFASLAILFSVKETEFVQSTRALYRITEVTEVWENGSTRERLLNWSIALKAFKERPIFGYGPENYASAANTYYDYRIGVGEPWFDRAHSQPLDTLATGGIVVFSLYVFWLAVVGFLIFKISKQKRMLSFLLASIFFAYFLQGLFLFDLLAVYLGLFPLLAFILFEYRLLKKESEENSQEQLVNQKSVSEAVLAKQLPILGLVGVVSLLVVYSTVFLPYKANAAAIQFYARSENGYYKESIPFLQESFNVQSPYTYWEVRKRAGWQLMNNVQHGLTQETPPEKVAEIQRLYDFIIPELEGFIEARPHDPQGYYVLGRLYRLGSQKLNRDDVEKAKIVLEKGFQYSDLRVEYVNEFAQILILQGKMKEAEQVIINYAEKVDLEETFPAVTLGHFYFVVQEYDRAFEQYEKARAAGYIFTNNITEYSRYLATAEEAGNYEKVVEMANMYLERYGPAADTYFNIAIGHFNTGNKEQAREFYVKAVELEVGYEKYRTLFFE